MKKVLSKDCIHVTKRSIYDNGKNAVFTIKDGLNNDTLTLDQNDAEWLCSALQELLQSNNNPPVDEL